MHAWEQIQLTINYIEEHVSEEIKMEQLAKLASLSPFYYQRLFKRLVKRPVNESIRLRRLANASEALLNKNERILDSALDHGFSSHEAFTRAFKDAFGMTPENFRTSPIRRNNFVKPQLSLNYTFIDENRPLIADGIVLEMTRRTLLSPHYFIGLTVEEPFDQIPGGGSTGADSLAKVWDDFHLQKLSIQQLKKNGDELGVMYAGTKDGHYRYFAGAEAVSDGQWENYSSWKLPEGEYVVCSFEAEDFEHLIMDAVYKAHQYVFETWLPNHKLVSKPFAAERYPSHSPETTSMEIGVMPVSE